MRRVLITKQFHRWMRRTALTDSALCEAVDEMVRGLIDADLGGGVFKKRVGLAGRGKRGGARTLLATNRGSRWIFIFGFLKNERSNISDNERAALHVLAADLLALAEAQVNKAVETGSLKEICYDREDQA